MDTASFSASGCLIQGQAADTLVRAAKRFALAHGHTRAFVGYAKRTVVHCESGHLWLTQTGDGRDILLTRGDRFACEYTGRVVVEALADSIVRVAE